MNTVNKNSMLKIGWVPYWNLHPFKIELLNHPTLFAEISYGVPSLINKWLEQGTISLAPCSSVCLFTQEKFEMAVPLGIAATGKVQSVYWGTQPEHEEFITTLENRKKIFSDIIKSANHTFGNNARKIAKYVYQTALKIPTLQVSSIPALHVTKESATSVMLTRVLFHLFFGDNFYYIARSKCQNNQDTKHRPMELLIGDEALKQRKKFHKIIDLGDLWYELTALPFVYAVWQSRGLTLNGWRRNIMSLGDRAEKKMKASPSFYLNTSSSLEQSEDNISLMTEYWKNLRYSLTIDDFKGLLLFLCLTRETQSPYKCTDSSLIKIIRWQELTSSQERYLI
jgi:predicted solute-binding protein